jgi:hypothetical protein
MPWILPGRFCALAATAFTKSLAVRIVIASPALALAALAESLAIRVMITVAAFITLAFTVLAVGVVIAFTPGGLRIIQGHNRGQSDAGKDGNDDQNDDLFHLFPLSWNVIVFLYTK